VVSVGDNRGDAAIVWIGQRRIDCLRHPQPQTVWPVRIRAGAFGRNQPQRDLFLSPDHAVFVDGLLIPIRLLMNGTTIRQEARPQVQYFHVEMERHGVLLAEGLPAESYLDTGNRRRFENGGAPLLLHPELAGVDERSRRSAGSCAPLGVQPVVVAPVWLRLAAQAADMGHPVTVAAMTTDPQLRLLVGGQAIGPVVLAANRAVFVLPQETSMAQLVSRAAAPADVRPWHDDRRRLGVSLVRVVCRRGESTTELPVDHPALSDGWHPVERDGCRQWRWTDGCARLSVPAGTETVELQLAHLAEYPLAEAVPLSHHGSGRRSAAAA
jgi:hypothetical protein